MAETGIPHLRRRTHEILEVAEKGDRASRYCDYALILLILANVVAVIVETLDPVREAYGKAFDVFELVSVIIFTVEYGLRAWSCVERDRALAPEDFWKSRLRYLVSPAAIIDLLAILPFYLSVIFHVDLRFLRALRLLRIFKLTRYSSAMTMLLNVFREEASSFCAAIFILIIILILASKRDLPGRGSGPAQGLRFHSPCHVVGHGDADHRGLRRCHTDHALGKGPGRRYHDRGNRHGGAAPPVSWLRDFPTSCAVAAKRSSRSSTRRWKTVS